MEASVPTINLSSNQVQGHFRVQVVVPLIKELQVPQKRSSLALPLSDRSLYKDLLAPKKVSEHLGRNSTYQLQEDVITRIRNEIEYLKNSIPCTYNSAIFARINANDIADMQFLVTGRTNSPFASGLFLLKSRVPPFYPSDPPKMTLKTMSNKVKFNSMICKSGKVSESFFNEGKWNPNSGSISDLVVTIQKHLLSEFKNSNSVVVAYATIKFGMIEMLKAPPEPFAEVVKTHFVLKKRDILVGLNEWLEGTNLELPENEIKSTLQHNIWVVKDFFRTGIRGAFQEAILELKQLLEGLPPIN